MPAMRNCHNPNIMSIDYVKALCQDIMSSAPGPPGVGPGGFTLAIRAVAIPLHNFLENAPTKKRGLDFQNPNQKNLFQLYAPCENGRQNFEKTRPRKRPARIFRIDLSICIYDGLWYSSQRPFSLVVRTPTSQVGDSGSNPLRVTFLSSSKRVKARCQ